MKEVCFPVGMKDSLTLPVKTVCLPLDYFIPKGFRNVLKGVFLCSNVLFKLCHSNVLLDAPWFGAAEQTAISVFIYRLFG